MSEVPKLQRFNKKTGPPKWQVSFYIVFKKWVFQAHRRVPTPHDWCRRTMKKNYPEFKKCSICWVSHMFSLWEYRYSYGICFGTVYALQNSTTNISTPNILSFFFLSTPVGLKSGIFYVGDHDYIYIYLFIYLYWYLYILIHIHVYIHTYIYIFIYLYIYLCKYIYIYIYAVPHPHHTTGGGGEHSSRISIPIPTTNYYSLTTTYY